MSKCFMILISVISSRPFNYEFTRFNRHAPRKPRSLEWGKMGGILNKLKSLPESPAL